MIKFESNGSFDKTEKFFKAASSRSIYKELEKYGRTGVQALSAATPVESGLTAASWDYEIINSKGSWSIVWTNSHLVFGIPIAILIQYGHGTGTGGYVTGLDYINPALRPIFDKIATDAWKVVTTA